jgi:signal peptidase I
MFLKNLSLHRQPQLSTEPAAWNFVSAETSALFEDILNSGLSLRIKATGRSMAPFLNGGEILTIRKEAGTSLHVGDLIFFKTRYGSLLLHRIIKKKNKDMVIFRTKGDAVPGIDEPVFEYDVLGKVCIIEKNISGMGTKRVNMESHCWRTINYLLAVFSSVYSRIYFAVSR